LGGLVAVRGLAPVSLSGFMVGYVGSDGRERHDGLAAVAAAMPCSAGRALPTRLGDGGSTSPNRTK
jgi:hypothetical protein